MYFYSKQDSYRELVDYLIAAQQDQDNKDRLTVAFTDLTRDLPLTSERSNKIKFKDNFDKFIVNVRGFLLVKWKVHIFTFYTHVI